MAEKRITKKSIINQIVANANELKRIKNIQSHLVGLAFVDFFYQNEDAILYFFHDTSSAENYVIRVDDTHVKSTIQKYLDDEKYTLNQETIKKGLNVKDTYSLNTLDREKMEDTLFEQVISHTTPIDSQFYFELFERDLENIVLASDLEHVLLYLSIHSSQKSNFNSLGLYSKSGIPYILESLNLEPEYIISMYEKDDLAAKHQEDKPIQKHKAL